MAQARREASHPPRLPASLWSRVDVWPRDEWSPQYIYQDKAAGGELYRHLRCQKKRKKRYGSYQRRRARVNTVSIDERPALIDRKTRPGDWEVDTVIGKGHRQARVTLTERKSMYTWVTHVKQRTAKAVRQAIVRLLSGTGKKVHTITSDNGREFAEYEIIAKALTARFYFAHPYASWERGLNENINGLIRQYFPKKMDFSTITQEQLNTVMKKLNHRPGKTLNSKTPHEVFFNINVALQS